MSQNKKIYTILEGLLEILGDCDIYEANVDRYPLFPICEKTTIVNDAYNFLSILRDLCDSPEAPNYVWDYMSIFQEEYMIKEYSKEFGCYKGIESWQAFVAATSYVNSVGPVGKKFFVENKMSTESVIELLHNSKNLLKIHNNSAMLDYVNLPVYNFHLVPFDVCYIDATRARVSERVIKSFSKPFIMLTKTGLYDFNNVIKIDNFEIITNILDGDTNDSSY